MNKSYYKEFKKELKQLIKLETPIFRDSAKGRNQDLRYYEDFNNDSNIMAFINCEFCTENIELVHIHYDIKYWGSDAFNALIKKYNCRTEWVDNCVLSINWCGIPMRYII